MSKEIAVVVFDYEVLDKDDKGKLLSIVRDINREKEKHADAGMEIGKSIASAHAILAKEGRDGQFTEWVEAECGFSRQTAYNYMWAWQKFGNCKSLLQFTQESLYALAAPTAPEKAVKEAERLADKGRKITRVVAKELLDKFREVESKPKAKPKAHEPDFGDDQPAAPPEPEATGPCPHGGPHTYDDEACTRCHDPKPQEPAPEPTPVGKLFSKLDLMMGQVVRLLDEINAASPNEPLRVEIMQSLDVANKDILRWRKKAKAAA